MKQLYLVLVIMACCLLFLSGWIYFGGMDSKTILGFLATKGFNGFGSGLVLDGSGLGPLCAGLLLIIIAAVLFISEHHAKGPFHWSRSRFLAAVLGLELVLGTTYILLWPYVFDHQDKWFYFQAKNLAAGINPIWNHSGITVDGGEFTAFWPIGYSVFLAPFFRIFGSSLLLAQGLNLLLLTGVTLLCYWLGHDLFGESVARRAALVLALTPSQTFYAVPIISDPLFAFLVMLLIYLVQKPPFRWRMILMAIIFGFAALTRPIILLFPLGLASYRIYRERRWRPALAQMVIILSIGECILLPWQIRNYFAFRQFVPFCTQGGVNFWMGNNAATIGKEIYIGFPDIASESSQPGHIWNEADRDRFLFQRGFAWMVSHPLKTIYNWPGKIFYLYYRDSKCVSWSSYNGGHLVAPFVLSGMFLITDTFYYSLMLSFVVGLIITLRREGLSLRLWLILGTILYFSFVYLWFVTEDRYHLPLIPLFVIIAMAGHALVQKEERAVSS